MPRKLTIQEVKDRTKIYDDGYLCLSDEYVNNRAKLKFQCEKNHIFDMTWNRFKDGNRCRKCSVLRQRHTIEFIKQQTKELATGYKCMSDIYIRSRDKLKFKCDKNHEFLMRWNDFGRGFRCPICKGLKQSKRTKGKKLLNMRGENNPNWNPNITEEERAKDRIDRRVFPEYTRWRTAVFERDEYTCQKCNDSAGGNLNAHHIESYSSSPELRIELSNGITFCKDCHNDFHHNYGYGNNTNRQLKEFLNGN